MTAFTIRNWQVAGSTFFLLNDSFLVYNNGKTKPLYHAAPKYIDHGIGWLLSDHTQGDYCPRLLNMGTKDMSKDNCLQTSINKEAVISSAFNTIRVRL